jgi:hypothetical protein
MSETIFEEELLKELRGVVRARGLEPYPAPRPHRQTLRYGMGFATAAAIAVIASVVFGTGTPPAYAVSRRSDGRVRVEIKRLSDADGLERQLEANGIHADVTYNPPGYACKQPRTTETGPMTDGGDKGTVEGDSGKDGHFGMTLDPKDFSGTDQTLVIELSGPEGATENNWTMVKVENAHGTVAPCERVAADSPPAPPPGAVTEFHSDDGSGHAGRRVVHHR